MSYATVAQLRSYLAQVATGAAKDAELQSVLDRANAILDGALGFGFAAWGEVASAKDVRGSRDAYLRPPAYEADSLSAISVVYSRAESYESTSEVTGWVVDEEMRPYRVYRGSGWPETWYRVTAIWGYGPAPENAIEAEIGIARNIWRSRDAAHFSATVGVEGAGSVAVNRAIGWAERNLIDDIRAAYLGVVHA